MNLFELTEANSSIELEKPIAEVSSEILFTKQCKAKELKDVSKDSKHEEYYGSIKYDGLYCQIVKSGNNIKMFSSAGKEFFYEPLAIDMAIIQGDIILECEYIGNTTGRLGSRDNLKFNDIPNNSKFKVFDIISNEQFAERLKTLSSLELGNFKSIEVIEHIKITLNEALNKVENYFGVLGVEGLILKHSSHIQRAGKRSNEAVKVKKLLTADFKVVEIDGLWLSLVDIDGYEAKIKTSRDIVGLIKIGTIVEVEYERFKDNYIQPRFKNIRFDKNELQ